MECFPGKRKVGEVCFEDKHHTVEPASMFRMFHKPCTLPTTFTLSATRTARCLEKAKSETRLHVARRSKGLSGERVFTGMRVYVDMWGLPVICIRGVECLHGKLVCVWKPKCM